MHPPYTTWKPRVGMRLRDMYDGIMTIEEVHSDFFVLQNEACRMPIETDKMKRWLGEGLWRLVPTSLGVGYCVGEGCNETNNHQTGAYVCWSCRQKGVSI